MQWHCRGKQKFRAARKKFPIIRRQHRKCNFGNRFNLPHFAGGEGEGHVGHHHWSSDQDRGAHLQIRSKVTSLTTSERHLLFEVVCQQEITEAVLLFSNATFRLTNSVSSVDVIDSQSERSEVKFGTQGARTAAFSASQSCQSPSSTRFKFKTKFARYSGKIGWQICPRQTAFGLLLG